MARASTTVSLISLALLLLVAVVVWRMSQDPQLFSALFSKDSFVGTSLTINGNRITVLVADTEGERQRGLSGRSGLGEGTGLLMKFDTDTSPGIWMKDMNFPIDVLWIDKDWRVVQVTPSIGPESFPAAFYPDQLVRYVLELPAGYADIHNIEAGTTVEH
jgi:uncharacterized protein